MPGLQGISRSTTTGATMLMRRISRRWRLFVLSMTLATLWIAGPVAPSSGSDFMMKGPRAEVNILDVKVDMETSNFRLALLGLIGMYQRFVSPIGGVDRCGFRPSCSNYGYQTIRDHGPFLGVLMIGDRQIRCNIFERPGYTRLPNGKLYDPISDNLLFKK